MREAADKKVRVFAYGSNLCVERLRARTPGAAVLGVATLAGHTLCWHKKSRDGSGKCNAFATGCDDDVVWGVVYELTPEDKVVLDACEGLGRDYFEKRVAVRTRSGAMLEAVAYVANPSLLDESVRPFGWYKRFVTAGAEQHGFPESYRAILDAVEERQDLDAGRHAKEREVLDRALRRIRSACG